MSAFRQLTNKIKNGFSNKNDSNLKRKKDLLLTTFYMNDFGEGD